MPTLLLSPELAATDQSIEKVGLSQKVEAADGPAPLKKKKKRRREEQGTDVEVAEQRKKKKKKKRHTVKERSEAVHLDKAAAGEVQAAEPQGERNKRASSQAVEPPINPVLETPEARDAAATLLSAIVAATSGSRDSGASERAQPSHSEAQYGLSHQNSPLESEQFPFTPYACGQLPFVPSVLPSLATESSLFPTGSNLSLSELNFGSNDDVLRALQALDMSKITSVLRNISEGPAGADDSTMAQPIPNAQAPLPHVQAPLMPVPMLAMGQAQVPIPNHRRLLGLPTSSVEQQGSPNHAHLLANKWLSASKLAELVRTEGLIYKKGKFSAFEEEQLEDAIERFRTSRGLNEDQIQELIFPQSEKTRDNIFWSELTSAVPLRPIIAVYHHVRRTHHPLKKQGVWNADEDVILEKAVIDHGQQWEKIGPIVGRMPSDCRDRYRNHIVNRNVRVTGVWSKEEEDQLTRIVTDMTVNQGRDIDGDVFWGRVSELMGGRRGRQQCRIKWTDALCKNVKTGGRKARWSPQDAYILVHKLTALDVRDDTEIDWKLLLDPVWNLWSPHTLQRRWLTMKRGIKGWEEMTHQEIMDILRVRKAHIPSPPLSRKKRERRITSATAVIEEAPAQSLPDGITESESVRGASVSQPTVAGPSEPVSSTGSSPLAADDASLSSDSE